MNIDFKPLLEKLAAQPNLTSTTPGPKCPECGSSFLVTFGRHSKRWVVMHSSMKTKCPRYDDQHPKSDTQEAALAVAQEAAK